MRLVIFDLDGTLINSEALIVETVSEAFRAVNEPVPAPADIRAISGITARDAMAMLAPTASPERVGEILESYLEHYHARAGTAREPLFEGALEMLDTLQADPETVLAVATGKGYRSTITLLERHGIVGNFHSIQTPDHNRGKPDPQMIRSAMERAGIGPEQTVMVGDTVHDMRMAKSAGVKALGVAWGYHGRTELEAAGADYVVDALDALPGAVALLLREI